MRVEQFIAEAGPPTSLPIDENETLKALRADVDYEPGAPFIQVVFTLPMSAREARDLQHESVEVSVPERFAPDAHTAVDAHFSDGGFDNAGMTLGDIVLGLN